MSIQKTESQYRSSKMKPKVGFNHRHAWSIIFVIFFCAELTSTSSSERGFLLTAPKVLIANGTEKLCLSLHGITSDGQVNVSLRTTDKLKTMVQTVQHISKGTDTCFEMAIPSTAIGTMELHLEGSFEADADNDKYRTDGHTTVSIATKSPLTFVQTDKPIYKPGQIVQFRVLSLDVDLKPNKEPVKSVWIKDPTGIRVAMWNNPESDQGLVDLSMRLSDEPPQGKWTITVQHEDSGQVFQTFTVKEYVLPKFSVEISSPPCIVPTDERSSWKVCAMYSYGEPVIGNLTITAGVKFRYGGMSSGSRASNFTLTTKINGCHDIEIDKDNLTNLESSNNWSLEVHFFAEVVEKGTNIKMNATKILPVRQHPYKVTLKHKTYFKPGLNFYGTAFVSFVDDRPAPNTTVMIAIQTFDKAGGSVYMASNDYQSDESGQIHFTVAPQSEDIEKIRIKTNVKYSSSSKAGRAYDHGYGDSHHTMVNSWHSPSKSYLQVEPTVDNDRPAPCNGKHLVTLAATFPRDLQGKLITLNYQVITRGDMLFQDKIQHLVNSEKMSDGTIQKKNETLDNLAEATDLKDGNLMPERIEIELYIESRMSPALHLLVFYVRPDRELVSDYAKITIENCLDNKVDVTFGDREILPGTSTKIVLEAQPQSLCALSAVDQSVNLLADNKQLDSNQVFSKLTDLRHAKKFQPYSTEWANDQCVQLPTVHPVMPDRYGMLYDRRSNYLDSMQTFTESGIAVISDLTLITRPCKEFKAIWFRGIHARNGLRVYNEPTMMRGLPGLPAETTALRSMPLDSLSTPKVGITKVDRQEPAVIAKPAVEIRNFFPETWLWELHKIGKEGKVKIERDIPHSVTTWTANTICTSSDKGLGISKPASIRSFQPFFLSYAMPYSVKNGELVPLKVTIFNYLSRCFTIKMAIEDNVGFDISGSRTERACVCGRQSHTHTFQLRPKKIGHLNVTVHAHSIGRQNTTSLCEEGTREADVVAHDAITKPLFVKAQGYPKEIVNTTMFCPSDNGESFSNVYTLVLPDNVVDGSARAYVKLIGDLMGPSITGLDKLVRLPTGCGEQNMVLFVPNIFVLQYLTNTHQLTDDVKVKAQSHLATGYQRQLTYRHLDGSYSAFGKSDNEGSMWLTAFVLKSFAQARPFTFIDAEELDNTMAYVKKHQMENGCFESKGRLLSKAMKGGLEAGQSSAMQALSAYVVVSLLEAGMSPSNDIIKNAFLCVEAEQKPGLYLLALKTYASTLYGSEELVRKNWAELEAKSIQKDGMMHWELEGQSNSLAVNIEITSYALLALTTINEPQSNLKALAVVKWLTQQRNANGGFVSTQDTVLAMQALSKYASVVANKTRHVDIEVKIETDDLDDTIYVNQGNRLVMQTRRLSHFPTVLDVEATGKGCALIEVTLKYNVEEEKFRDAFALETDVDCEKEQIHICTRYKNSDAKSNMAVIEVNMLSGYEAYKTKLDELKNDARTPVKRAEVNDEGTVSLYFDEITMEKFCVDIDVHRTIDVEDVKPAFISVYDYYQPELYTTNYYTFGSSPNCSEKVPRSSGPVNCTEDDERCKQPNRPATPVSGQIRRQRTSRRANPEEPNVFFEPDFLDNRGYPPSPTLSPSIFDSVIGRTPDCPACLPTFPPNFPPLLCYGDIAVIATVRNTATRRIKLNRNAHNSLDQFQRLNIVTQYDIGSQCTCGLLSAGQQVLIVGKLPTGTTGIPEPIRLDRSLYVIKLDQRALQRLRRFHKQCPR